MSKGRVLSAMSGGVDSSVATALLLEQGYEVIGVTMQVWPELSPVEEARRGGCCSITAVNDAQLVADQLGIPYYVFNMQEIFQKLVIDYFVEEYTRGRTPNPCIACNKFIKFDALLQKALQLGCDYVATGHYARISYDADTSRYLLYRGRDSNKDQTYALYDLRQEQLARILFPLADLTKPEVRRIAASYNFVNADKPDSQEICFVVDNDYGAFIESRSPEAVVPGPIYDTDGRRLGTHKGLPHYTIGQRKGLGLSSSQPLYVVDILPEQNAIVVGTANEVFFAGLIAESVNWIAFERLARPRSAAAKVRYKSPEALATLYPLDDDRVLVQFEEPQRAVTPGQSVVFYDGDLVLGGGVIAESLRESDLVRFTEHHMINTGIG